MIICPNCNYQNPEGASQCEACYTPLPSLMSCPNCGAPVQADASFCGQCGHSLASSQTAVPMAAVPSVEPDVTPDVTSPIPASTASSELVEPDPLVSPDPVPMAPPPPLPAEPIPENSPPTVDIYSAPPVTTPPSINEPLSTEPAVTQTVPNIVAPQTQTQIQSLTAQLLHVQTDTLMELPMGMNLVHIGKPNERIPPDIDVSGVPESEIVSRVHANIRIEGDVYYIEDVGSSNGTYINNLPLATGNRHRLRPGDRIALGKGDKVSFIFQLT